MATLNLGRIKPVFKGAYSGGTAYVIDDIVTSGGSSYICIQAHGAGTQAVTVTAYWSVMASTGTDIGTTITTQGDILFRDGSGLQRLAKPASNKFLQNTSGGVPSWETVASSIVSVGFATNNTRYSLGSSNDAPLFTVTFVKTLAAAASKIIVQGLIPTRGVSSDWSGIYFDCLTSGVTTHTTDDSHAFKGINMGSAFSATTSGNIMINQQWEDTTNLGAATHTFEFGWHTKDGTSNKPALQINPTNADDGRIQTTGSTFTFFEVAL